MATLTDTGPLVALLDRGQSAHSVCADVFRSSTDPLLTTWPCLTESMHLLGAVGGWKLQKALWNLVASRNLYLYEATVVDQDRIQALMEKYTDTPMSLADASLVTAAERRKDKRIFTLDSDFQVYRIHDKEPFEIIPGFAIRQRS